MPIGVELRYSARVCAEKRQVFMGYVYGDYFLAEDLLAAKRRNEAATYADDGLAAVRAAEHYALYPDLTAAMEKLYDPLDRAIRHA